ncbi:MAG: OsmC family peroxiredoxin [Nocardioidaceae bacterium]
MTDNTATTRWTGDLKSGSGALSLDTSGAAEFIVSFPARTGETHDQTNPEELIAAAHSTCLAMNFTGVLGRNELDATSVDVTSTVTLGKSGDGLAITGIALLLEADVPGLEEAKFQELAEEAERTCPVSKALAGTDITLTAKLSG